MRKILLGTTAVVGAALLAPSFAAAQEAPTVRIGGFFRAYYGYTQQTGRNSTQVTSPGLGGSTLPTGVAGGTGNLTEPTKMGIARLIFTTAPNFQPLAADLVEIDPGSGSATARRERLDEPR